MGKLSIVFNIGFYSSPDILDISKKKRRNNVNKEMVQLFTIVNKVLKKFRKVIL